MFLTFVFYLNVQCIEYISRIYILLDFRKHYLIHSWCLLLKSLKAFSVSLSSFFANLPNSAVEEAHYLSVLVEASLMFFVKGQVICNIKLCLEPTFWIIFLQKKRKTANTCNKFSVCDQRFSFFCTMLRNKNCFKRAASLDLDYPIKEQKHLRFLPLNNLLFHKLPKCLSKCFIFSLVY